MLDCADIELKQLAEVGRIGYHYIRVFGGGRGDAGGVRAWDFGIWFGYRRLALLGGRAQGGGGSG